MKPVQIVCALALALTVAACGGSETTAQNNLATPPADTGPNSLTYSATGIVTALSGDRVTISHGPVEGLGWPAVTMTYQARDPAMLQGLSVGDRVAFQFHQSGIEFPLTAISKAP